MLASPLVSYAYILRLDVFLALLSLLYTHSLSPFRRAGSRVQRLLVRPSVRCIFLARVAARSRTVCLTVFFSPRCLPMVTEAGSSRVIIIHVYNCRKVSKVYSCLLTSVSSVNQFSSHCMLHRASWSIIVVRVLLTSHPQMRPAAPPPLASCTAPPNPAASACSRCAR